MIRIRLHLAGWIYAVEATVVPRRLSAGFRPPGRGGPSILLIIGMQWSGSLPGTLAPLNYDDTVGDSVGICRILMWIVKDGHPPEVGRARSRRGTSYRLMQSAPTSFVPFCLFCPVDLFFICHRMGRESR
jgi:hypothetical protein